MGHLLPHYWRRELASSPKTLLNYTNGICGRRYVALWYPCCVCHYCHQPRILLSSLPQYEKSQVLAKQCLPQVFARQCYSAFRSQTQKQRWHAIQRDVVSTLHTLGLNPKAEVCTQHGYRLDAIVEVKGKSEKESVGVIVDVRRNMMARDEMMGKQPNGKTLLKRRQISSVEWIR